jgi:hypothetical protein
VAVGLLLVAVTMTRSPTQVLIAVCDVLDTVALIVFALAVVPTSVALIYVSVFVGEVTMAVVLISIALIVVCVFGRIMTRLAS